MAQETVPAELVEVAQFTRTIDVYDGVDELADVEGLRAWLVGRGLLEHGAPVSEEDRETAVALRSALRDLLLAHHGDRDPAAAAAADEAARHLPLRLSFDRDGDASLRPAAGGVPGALGAIVAGIPTAMATGTWQRLKLCPDDACAVPFYDRSKNQSRRWCSMEVCGNRQKTRVYRGRRRTAS